MVHTSLIFRNAHGWKRQHARRIPTVGIELAIEFGRTWYSCGAFFYRLDRRSIYQARTLGLRLERFEGITVIVDERGCIATTYRNRKGGRVWR
jgi:hypothetical protein